MDGNLAQDMSKPIPRGKMASWTALEMAAHGRDVTNIRPQILVKMLELGADPKQFPSGKDCLFRAAATGCFDSVAALLSTGKFNPHCHYNVNGRDKTLGSVTQFNNYHIHAWLDETFGIKKARLISYVG